ncbi:MAG: SpaA isopeptide-forming pilin-related protein, partial [Micromonosporaceae bacterium]
VLYSKWGTTSGTAGNFGTGGYASEGGFEEWKVRKAPNVTIVKTADADSVNAGQNIGFLITVTNNGAADATGVVISDPLPAGTGIDWQEAPTDNPNCSIAGSPPTETLNCGPVTLAAGGGSISVHVQSATTGASCGTYNNTATFTSTNAGTDTATDSVAVNCGALQILKNSVKGGAVANAGAVFSVDGPDANTDPDFTVTDDTDAAAPDEAAAAGVVCVTGLAPGAYTVTETTAPSGYAVDAGAETATVVAGSTCASPGTGTVTFVNPPLYDIQVNFRDGGSGETSPTSISCTGTNGTGSTTAATGWDDSLTFEGEPLTANPETIVCTIVVDP